MRTLTLRDFCKVGGKIQRASKETIYDHRRNDEKSWFQSVGQLRRQSLVYQVDQIPGKTAYITVNDVSGDNLPTTLEEPVLVAVHDLKSGNELEDPQNISSLGSYLESLGE